MTDTSYSGWTNYETWAVKLWIDNDEGTQSFWLEMAKQSADQAPVNQFSADRRQEQRIYLASVLKDEHDGGAEDWMGDQSSVYADLMNAALGSVNWYEIADSLLDDVEEQAA